MKVGLTLAGAKGIGDKLIFTSFPENYFAATGNKLIDLDKLWVFDFNPFVERDIKPDMILNPWTRPIPTSSRPWHSVAERTLVQFGLNPSKLVLRHPRLYKYEDIKKTGSIVVHTLGVVSKTPMSTQVITQIRKHFGGDYEFVQVGGLEDPIFSRDVTDLRGASMWQVAEAIAQADVFIGVDSGPSWIAAAYPNVIAKKILTHLSPAQIDVITPMDAKDSSTHWFDSCFTYFNLTDHDIGFTYSYLKL